MLSLRLFQWEGEEIEEDVVIHFDKELYNEVMHAFDGVPTSPGAERPQQRQPDWPMRWSSF